MSISRFTGSLLLSLVLPLLAYASALNPKSRETVRTPGVPFKAEKFILRLDELATPPLADAPATKEKTEERAAEKAADTHASERPATLPAKADLNVAQRPLFSHSAGQMTLIERAYLDTYNILREQNSCSRFFGGPRISTGVLNALYPRLKKSSYDDGWVGISMSGDISYVTDMQTGAYYRLFEDVTVNERGPFYESLKSPGQGFFRPVGRFPANTRAARVAMLLHEMGHLLTDASHKWLLADDGGNEALSRANTQVIMDRCSSQIKSLSGDR